jgi:hypothetical protein
MDRTSVRSRSRHAPSHSTTDSNLRILLRSVRRITRGFQDDRVGEILEGVANLRLLAAWDKSNENSGPYSEKQHLDGPSRKDRYGESHHYEFFEPISLQKNQKDVTKRDHQNPRNDLLQECLELERCYHCGKARSNRTLHRQVEPLEIMICSRPRCAWLKATIANTLTSKDLAINIYHYNCYNNQLSKPPSSREIRELPGHSDVPTYLSELPGETLRNPEGAMPLLNHDHDFCERAPPAINGITKPSRSLVERVVWQNKNWGNMEMKQSAIGCGMCSEHAAFHYGKHPRCGHGMSLRR